MTPLWAADAVAVVHAAYVAFVVIGQAVILVGGPAGWSWIRNPWFRWLHLAAMALVIVEVILGAYCPLTVLEAGLRARAGADGYGGSFIGHWVQRLIYYDIPLWQAHVAYVAFGALVAWSLWRWPPRGGLSR